MAALVVYALVSCFTLLVLWYFKSKYEKRNFPPGPPSLPLVGCTPFLKTREGGRNLMLSVDLIPKYGDIIGYDFGPMKVVFIQDFSKAKEIAFSDKFTGRVQMSHIVNNVRGINGQSIGILFTDGQIWKSLRRFSLQTLRDFGFGKQSMEVIIREEVDMVLEELFEQKFCVDESDALIRFPFNVSIFNIIWRIVAGQRFENTDLKLFEMFEDMSQMIEHAFIELMFPVAFKILPTRMIGSDAHQKHCKDIKNLIRQVITEHQRSRIPHQPRDFIDAFLDNSDIESEKSSFNEDQLIGVCMDFFEAGGETVGNTLSWVLLYLSLYPREQEKCQKEIDLVVGKEQRNVTLADKPNLPFCQAFIWEVQRLSCVAPAGLEHRALEDVPFHGYTIPKDTMVYYNIYWFHMDPQYWGDPKVFRPSRFIEQNGSQIKTTKSEFFIPFGFGKRVCMGETLAKAELWLFVTSILKRFTISLPGKHPVPNPDDDIAGLTRAPKPFYVRVESRNK